MSKQPSDHDFIAIGTFDSTSGKPLSEKFKSLKLVVGDSAVDILGQSEFTDKKISDLKSIVDNTVVKTVKQTTEIGHDGSADKLEDPALTQAIAAATTAAAGNNPPPGKFVYGGSRARGGSYKRTQKRRQRKQQRRNGKSKRV